MVTSKIIGIDIDNTLFSCNSFLYNFVARLKISSSKKALKYAEIPNDKNAKIGRFWKCFNFFNPKLYKAFPDAVEIINKLHDNGNQIILITSRPNLKPFIKSLQEWLNAGGELSMINLLWGVQINLLIFHKIMLIY